MDSALPRKGPKLTAAGLYGILTRFPETDVAGDAGTKVAAKIIQFIV